MPEIGYILQNMDKIKLVADIVDRLKVEKEGVESKLKRRKEEIGEADGPMQSIGISLTRFALEEELVMMEKTIKRLNIEITDLKKIKKSEVVTVVIDGKEIKLLLTEEIEDFNNGVISAMHPVGQILKNNPKKKLVISEKEILKEMKKLKKV